MENTSVYDGDHIDHLLGTRLYSSLWSYAGALEMMYVVSACILDAIVVAALILVRNWGDMFPVPRSFYILYGLFFTCADHGMQIFLSWT